MLLLNILGFLSCVRRFEPLQAKAQHRESSQFALEPSLLPTHTSLGRSADREATGLQFEAHCWKLAHELSNAIATELRSFVKTCRVA